MSNDQEDISKLVTCTCLTRHDELQIEDLEDADFRDPECPLHGYSDEIIQE